MFIITVGSKEASIYQPANGGIVNPDISKLELNDESSNEVSKHSFMQGLDLAMHLFSERLATQRRLIIVSCGNCLDYSAIQTLKLEKLLRERSVIVSAWGDYSMVDLNRDSEDSSETIIGYSPTSVFILKNDELSTDILESYKVA